MEGDGHLVALVSVGNIVAICIHYAAQTKLNTAVLAEGQDGGIAAPPDFRVIADFHRKIAPFFEGFRFFLNDFCDAFSLLFYGAAVTFVKIVVRVSNLYEVSCDEAAERFGIVCRYRFLAADGEQVQRFCQYMRVCYAPIP